MSHSCGEKEASEMKPSPITTLFEQVKALSFANIRERQEELLTAGENAALSLIHQAIAISIDGVLDVHRKTASHMLLQCCIELPALFTNEPDAVACIRENHVTAQHCVYHHLYDLLSTMVEDELLVWYRERKEESVA